MADPGSDEDIWFDGVDKKLIEIHSRKGELVEANDKSLTTKTPLASFSSYSKKKRESEKAIQQAKQGQSTSNGKQKAKISDAKKLNAAMKPSSGITDELAIDCEMVECYHNKSVLARVSIVNLFGHPILDKFVAPPDKVTDFRTKWSGIRPKDIANAPDFESVQQEVADLIKGRIVVGHSVHNDFAVLKLRHPPDMTRDTSKYFKYLFQGKVPSLKKLSETVLGLKIQKGEHDSVQDAQATMKLYVKERDRWNQEILKSKSKQVPTNGHRQRKKPLKKKIKTFYVTT